MTNLFGRAVRPLRPLVLALALIAAASLAGLPAAWADEDGPSNRAPRVTVPVGGLTVVLVSGNDQLYAFVDRVEDNAPAEDAALTVTRAGKGQPIALTRASAGLFVAPFKRTGLTQDVFTLTVTSADGSGTATAKLIYDDQPVAAGHGPQGGFGRMLAIALVSGALGVLATVLATRWWTRRARRFARAEA